MDWPSYVAGLITPPLLIALPLAVDSMLGTGIETTCVVCGYSTGDRKTTRRIVHWARWSKHKLITRPFGSCSYSEWKAAR